MTKKSIQQVSGELLRVHTDATMKPQVQFPEEIRTRLEPYMVDLAHFGRVGHTIGDAGTTEPTREGGKAISALECLSSLVSAMAVKDLALYQQNGGLEATQFLRDLVSGANHPLLEAWQSKRAGGVPQPSERELVLRKIIIAGSIALQNVGIRHNSKARAMAAAAALKSKAMDRCTAEGIRKWEEGDKNNPGLKIDPFIREKVDQLGTNTTPHDVCEWITYSLRALGMPPTHWQWVPPHDGEN